MQNQNTFLGRGWSFPPTFDINSRSNTMLENEADIKSSLEILLSTIAGERVMQPKYGCDMTPMLFEPLTTSLKTLMTDKIKTSIALYEARIELLKVELSSEQILEGIVIINIEYLIRSTNSRHNIVYPYYIGEATEAKQNAPVLKNN